MALETGNDDSTASSTRLEQSLFYLHSIVRVAIS